MRLIDADAAIEKANASNEIVGSSIWETYEVVEFIDGCPTIEAAPVVHGRWIETPEGTICSECHEYPFEDGYYALSNYNGDWCPNCGAKMDGGDDD